jgi:hypothetical protein
MTGSQAAPPTTWMPRITIRARAGKPSSSPGSTNPWNGDSVDGGTGSEPEPGGPDGAGPPCASAGIAAAGAPDAPGADSPLGDGSAEGVGDAPGRTLGSGSEGSTDGKDVGRGSDGSTVGSVGVGSGSVGVGSGRVGVGSGSVGLASGSVGVAYGSVGVGSGRVGVARGRVGVARGRVGVATGSVGSSTAGAPDVPGDRSSARANTALGMARPMTSATIAAREPDAGCRNIRLPLRASTGPRGSDWRRAAAPPGSTPFR